MGGGGAMGGGTSKGTVLSCSARFKASWILLMASFRVLRWLLNYCDPFLAKDDSSCAEGLPPSLTSPHRCGPLGGPWGPARRARIHEQLRAQHRGEPASPDRRKN